MEQDNRVQDLRRQFTSLRRLYLLCLCAAVLALLLHLIDNRLTLILLGANLIFHLTVLRGKSRRYTRDFIHLGAQLTLERHLSGACHTREPVLDDASIRAVRMLPANTVKGAILLREGGSGLYHGRRVRLGDATLAHSFPVAARQHEFIVGCWVKVDLENDTGMDCRFLGEHSAARYSLSKMLADEPDLDRRPVPAELGPGWTVVYPDAYSKLPPSPFLRQLNLLGKRTHGSVAVCVHRSELHFMLIHQILGQKVSGRIPPGDGFQNADLLPDLTAALQLTDYLESQS